MEKFKSAKLNDADGDIQKRWFVYYFFIDPDTGKYRRFQHWIPQKILSASGRRDKAHEMIRAINKKLRLGFNPFAHQEKRFALITVAVDYVMKIKQNTCRLRTHHTYSSFGNQFKEWLSMKKMSNIAVDDFNVHHAQDFMDYTQSVLKNSNRTYNNRVTAMRTMFKMLVKREWILVNPFENIERVPKEDPEIIAFTVDELRIMQEYLPAWNYDLYVCACLIFYCFIRPAELCRLKIGNFQLSKRCIIIPGKAAKNKKQDVVQIPDALVPILRRLDLGYPDEYFVFGKDMKRSPVEYAPTRMAEAWLKFRMNYGLNKQLYSLKHTGVGMAIESGLNIRDLQLQLRHSNLEMTQIYLDKFNVRPSQKLSSNFPDLARLTRRNGPVHLPLSDSIYSPGLS